MLCFKIINSHSHLFHKNFYSEEIYNLVAKSFSKVLGVSEEVINQRYNPSVRNSRSLDGEAMVHVMDYAGIDKAIVSGIDLGLTIIGEAKWSVEEMNQWVAKQVNEYSDKLIGLCAVDLRRGERAIKLLEKAVEEWGMKGVKLHPCTGFYPNDPKFFPFYEKCVELNITLHSHTKAGVHPPLDSRFADPLFLDTIASKFPDLKINMIHFGGISWIFKCLEIMTAKPNIYADISGHQLYIVGMPQYWLTILRNILDTPTISIGQIKDRVMFGTDWPYFKFIMDDRDWVNWLKNISENGKKYGLNFRPSEIKKILGLNSKKMLNI
ncbi:MAG: amidohydrolase family protein [Promethearchaeota archaeon]